MSPSFEGLFINRYKVVKNLSSTMSCDQKIDSLAREVNVAYICISVIRELIKQSEENLDIFKEYGEFFYRVYQTSYERLYTTLSRLQDNTKSTISIFKVIAKSSLNENERKSFLKKTSLR